MGGDEGWKNVEKGMEGGGGAVGTGQKETGRLDENKEKIIWAGIGPDF